MRPLIIRKFLKQGTKAGPQIEWSEIKENTARNLKTAVIPTRKCARVPINPTREAGTGTGKETKTPNGIKIKEFQKIGREENYLMKLKEKFPGNVKGNNKLLWTSSKRKNKIVWSTRDQKGSKIK